MNESSVVLDPPVRTVGVLQVIQDADPLPQPGESNLTTSSKCLFMIFLRICIINIQASYSEGPAGEHLISPPTCLIFTFPESAYGLFPFPV